MKNQLFDTSHRASRQRLVKRLWHMLLFILISVFSINLGACTQPPTEPEAPTKKEAVQPVAPSASPAPPAVPRPEIKQPPPVSKDLPINEVEVRKRLSELGYWVTTEGVAKSDSSLRHALIAFQKIEGRKRNGKLTGEEVQVLHAAQTPTPRQTGFPHIEVDLAQQVLFMVEMGGVPLRVLPVSTGSGKWYIEKGKRQRAVTPIGEFKVERKIKGRRKSDLGLLFDPCYFHNGIAIHGNSSVPAQPASHGCVRIPLFASPEVGKLTEIGTPVFVYE
ncbi:MAG: L,D-transpeptidase [Blastocatellia bacterium]|nr:L,D-transpeptidase [Blastocatellia bacterium]